MRNPFTIIIDGVLLVKGLKNNLLSVSKLCYKRYSITFDTLSCLIEKKSNKKLVFKCYKIDNILMLSLSDVSKIRTKCLVTQSEDFWLWHGRLSHVHFELINMIVSKEITINLPEISFNKKSYMIFIVLAKNTKRLTSTMQVKEILK